MMRPSSAAVVVPADGPNIKTEVKTKASDTADVQKALGNQLFTYVKDLFGEDTFEKVSIRLAEAVVKGDGLAARSLIQDFAALNKVEVEVWDVTGFMDIDERRNPEAERLLLRIVELTTSSYDRLPELRSIYKNHDELQVPIIMEKK